jgi:glucosamine--fructose-6-phosphate aminotransferase (isomerizing)
MAVSANYTYQEIISQPKAWAQALKVMGSLKDEINRLWETHPNPRVIFTGCGSTYYLSLAAASLFQELTGWGTRAVPGGELILYPDTAYEKDIPTLLVAISRSGTTSETVAAVRKFKQADRGPVLVITNYEDTPLSKLGDISVAIPAGQEESVAQTRSFASMYVAATAFAAICAERVVLLSAMEKLPALGEKLINQYDGLARRIGKNLELDRFYFLGSGPRYGLACETNLKLKEMTLTHSEPFYFFEFRHGPMSMVTNTAMVIGMRSSLNASHEQTVLDEMRSLGGQVLSLGESDADVAFESQLPEEVRNVLYLPVLQLMAYYRAQAKGLDPDNPRNLSAVIQLDIEKI